MTTGSHRTLPPLPLEEWEATKDTLHLWLQVVGKIRLASAPPKNHWWHVPYHLGARGITTRPMRQGDTFFAIDFDFVDHRLVVATDAGQIRTIPLVDGLSVAEFHDRLFDVLADLGLHPVIRAEPFGVPWMTTPFPEDTAHASYQAEYVERFWRIVEEASWVFEEFAGWYSGKSSPVHLFWHSFDLAVSRFSGRPAPELTGADPVTREAYSHEVVSFGFWAGDPVVRAPGFYSYTAPEPPGLAERGLQPDTASWLERPTGHLAFWGYDEFRRAPAPRESLLTFLQSAYSAGAEAAGWPREALASSWSPSPPAPSHP